MFMRRRGLRRVAAMAVVGGGAYYAGRKSAQAQERKTQLAESAPPATSQEPSGQTDKLEQLKKLGELRDAGTITEQEFEREKQKIMAAE